MVEQTVLVVDDDPRTIELLHHALDLIGVQMIYTQSGQDSIRMAEEEIPDLILMDLLLPAPSISGWEAIQRLKENATSKQIPIIVITAAGGDGIMRAMQAGADDYLEKPFSIIELRRKISRLLEVAKH